MTLTFLTKQIIQEFPGPPSEETGFNFH